MSVPTEEILSCLDRMYRIIHGTDWSNKKEMLSLVDEIIAEVKKRQPL